MAIRSWIIYLFSIHKVRNRVTTISTIPLLHNPPFASSQATPLFHSVPGEWSLVSHLGNTKKNYYPVASLLAHFFPLLLGPKIDCWYHPLLAKNCTLTPFADDYATNFSTRILLRYFPPSIISFIVPASIQPTPFIQPATNFGILINGISWKAEFYSVFWSFDWILPSPSILGDPFLWLYCSFKMYLMTDKIQHHQKLVGWLQSKIGLRKWCWKSFINAYLPPTIWYEIDMCTSRSLLLQHQQSWLPWPAS